MTSHLRTKVDLNQQISDYIDQVKSEKRHGHKISYKISGDLRGALIAYKKQDSKLENLNYNKTIECLLEAANKNIKTADTSYYNIEKYQLSLTCSFVGWFLGAALSIFINAISQIFNNDKKCCVGGCILFAPMVIGLVEGWSLGAQTYERLTEIEEFHGSASKCLDEITHIHTT